MSKKLSVVIISRNEEQNIENCLKSVSFADEIIVIDDFSDDDTVKISKKFGAKVFLRKLNNNFASQRNFGIKKTSGDWILFIDPDERVNANLKSEIVQKINQT